MANEEAYPFSMDVNIRSLYIVHEVLSGTTFKERYTGTSFMGTEEDIEDRTTSYDLKEVLVCGAVR